MAKGIKKQLYVVRDHISAKILRWREERIASTGYLTAEAYAAGYRDAVKDVLLALDGWDPEVTLWIEAIGGTDA